MSVIWGGRGEEHNKMDIQYKELYILKAAYMQQWYKAIHKI